MINFESLNKGINIREYSTKKYNQNNETNLTLIYIYICRSFCYIFYMVLKRQHSKFFIKFQFHIICLKTSSF